MFCLQEGIKSTCASSVWQISLALLSDYWVETTLNIHVQKNSALKKWTSIIGLNHLAAVVTFFKPKTHFCQINIIAFLSVELVLVQKSTLNIETGCQFWLYNYRFVYHQRNFYSIKKKHFLAVIYESNVSRIRLNDMSISPKYLHLASYMFFNYLLS